MITTTPDPVSGNVRNVVIDDIQRAFTWWWGISATYTIVTGCNGVTINNTRFDKVILTQSDSISRTNRFNISNGIIADNGDFMRECYVEGERDHQRFLDNLSKFDVNTWAKDIMLRYSYFNRNIVTARTEEERKTTLEWLTLRGVPYERIFFKETPNQSDVEYKRGVYLYGIKPHTEVLFAIDDNPAIVEMYRQEGVPALLFHTNSYRGGSS